MSDSSTSDERAIEQQLGNAILRRSEDIMRRWMEQVVHDIGSRGLSPTEFRDAIGEYLEAVARALTAQDPGSLNERGSSAWARIARAHGLTRVRQGFDIQELVHEFFVLRRVFQDIAAEEGIHDHLARNEHLAALVEGAIANSVQSYVGARDKEARRLEAEHIGFVTHELRNPLTSVMIATQRLRQLLPGQEKSLQILDLADRSLERLKGLIDQVLQAERMEAGAIAAMPTEILLDELLREPLQAARKSGERTSVSVLAPAIPEILLRVDGALARSAVQNVLDNAVKYSDHGPVEVQVDVEPFQAILHVRDHCDGLSEEELQTIFLPFRRGHSGHEGTGLGLAIARRSVEAFGGTIHAESNGEKGCHFWLTLPRASH